MRNEICSLTLKSPVHLRTFPIWRNNGILCLSREQVTICVFGFSCAVCLLCRCGYNFLLGQRVRLCCLSFSYVCVRVLMRVDHVESCSRKEELALCTFGFQRETEIEKDSLCALRENWCTADVWVCRDLQYHNKLWFILFYFSFGWLT